MLETIRKDIKTDPKANILYLDANQSKDPIRDSWI